MTGNIIPFNDDNEVILPNCYWWWWLDDDDDVDCCVIIVGNDILTCIRWWYYFNEAAVWWCGNSVTITPFVMVGIVGILVCDTYWWCWRIPNLHHSGQLLLLLLVIQFCYIVWHCDPLFPGRVFFDTHPIYPIHWQKVFHWLCGIMMVKVVLLKLFIVLKPYNSDIVWPYSSIVQIIIDYCIIDSVITSIQWRYWLMCWYCIIDIVICPTPLLLFVPNYRWWLPVMVNGVLVVTTTNIEFWATMMQC